MDGTAKQSGLAVAKKPFKARKTRERAPTPTTKVGPALVPSSAIEAEYRRQVNRLVLEAVLPARALRIGYAEDRLTVNSMKALKKKAFALAADFVSKVNAFSARRMWSVIEELGKDLTVGKAELSPMLRVQVEANVQLITNMAVESQEKLTKLYQEHGPDQSKIYGQLEEYVGSRAKLIANDQNSKIFTSLNTERMLESGLETFVWDHSSAGKTPRPCHVKRDGHTFLLKGGPSELYFVNGADANSAFGGKKGDEGKPGWAINCRCRMRPSVSLDD